MGLSHSGFHSYPRWDSIHGTTSHVPQSECYCDHALHCFLLMLHSNNVLIFHHFRNINFRLKSQYIFTLLTPLVKVPFSEFCNDGLIFDVKKLNRRGKIQLGLSFNKSAIKKLRKAQHSFFLQTSKPQTEIHIIFSSKLVHRTSLIISPHSFL